MSGQAAGMGLQVLGTVVSFVPAFQWLGVLMIMAGSAVRAVTAPKPKTDRDPGDGGHLLNTRSSRAPLMLLYGKSWIGVNKTFYHSANPYLHIVCELCEGEVLGIERADGTVYTETGSQLPSANPPLVFLDDKLWTEYGDSLVYMEFFNGSPGQGVCAALQAASGGKWDQTLRHTAYLYVRLMYDGDKFKSEPEFRVKLHGLKIHNPVSAETAWTDNAALCACDFMTRSSQRGGMGIASERIDLTALDAAVDYCAAKGWTCHLPVTENQAAADNLALIFACFRGDVIYSESRFKLKFRDLNHEPVVMDLGADDVVAASGRSTLRIRQPNAVDRPNAVRAVWLADLRDSKPDDYVFPDRAAVAADGDVRERQVRLIGFSSLDLVQKMSAYLLERERLNRETSFTARERAKALEPLDLVRLTHPVPGWDRKILRVMGAGISGGDTVQLALIEEDETFYDDAYNLSAQDYHATELIDPSADPPDVANVSLAEEVYDYRGRSFTRLNVGFDPPPDYPWFDHVEVWMSTDGGAAYRHQFNAASGFALDPVEEGASYWVRLRTVNVFGTRQRPDTAVTLSRTVIGKTSVPASLAALSAIPGGDTVILAAGPVADPDVVGYEVRIGDSWAGGLFFAFNLDSRMAVNNVRPGVHTFWMAPRDNAGRYANTPASASVEVFLPSGYTLANSWGWDFDGIGVFDNAEHAVYNSQEALKCSHSAGGLSGSWTSPEYDLGSIRKVRVFGDFRCAFVSPAGSFASVWGTGKTFADADPLAAKSFSELFALTEAGILRARLRWGDASGALSSEVDWFEITAPEIEGRYVQVTVELTDPALDSNLYLYVLNMKAYTF